MKKKLICIILPIFLINCLGKGDSEHTAIGENDNSGNSELMNSTLMDSLLFQAIEQGDIKAYNEVFDAYYWKHRDREVIYYSFIMANKHKYPQAFFNVFYSLTFPYNDSLGLKKLDSRTKNMSLYYLLKAYELGHEDSKYTIRELFDSTKEIPKSSDYLIFK